MKYIVNVETGETVERELNKNEIEQEKKDIDYFAEINAGLKAEAEAKAAARQALLDKLGITAEEATLLLGGN